MSFNIGDVVRIGKGKVEYEIFATRDETFDLQDANGRNRYGMTKDKLTLVQSAAVLTDAQQEELQETFVDHGMQAAKEAARVLTNELRPYMLTVDQSVSSYKSFGAACDALVLAQRDGFECATVRRAGKVLVKR